MGAPGWHGAGKRASFAGSFREELCFHVSGGIDGTICDLYIRPAWVALYIIW